MINLKSKRFFITQIVLLLFVSLAIYAGGQQEPAAAGAPEAEEIRKEPVKITFWYALGGNSGEAVKKLVEEFNKQSKTVIVEGVYSGKYGETAQKITTALVSNTVPNGGIIPAGPIFTGGRGNYKILDYIEKQKDFDQDDFYPGIWDYARYKGKICAIPFNISTPIMYYNKKLLTETGLDPDKPPQTWEALLEAAKKITRDINGDGAPDIWGFDTKDSPWIFKSFLLQNDNMIIDSATEDPLFDNESGVETAAYWKKLIDAQAMPVGMHQLAEKQFLGGNLAFLMASSNRLGRWLGKTDFEFGVAFLPENKRRAVAVGGAVLVLFPYSEDEDNATWEFINWLTKPEQLAQFATTTGYIPIRKSILDLPSIKQFLKSNPVYKVAYEQLAYAFSYWHFEMMGEMDRILYESLEKIERGLETPEEAMQKGAAELRELIKS
jgi:sn-glycerol 3-phosphate transport system substrate-binding protein